MGKRPTNSFDTFSSQAEGHENHLTRALVILVRLSPMAHEVWLRYLGLAEIGTPGMGEPSYALQTQRVPGLQDLDEEAESSCRGISVFIAQAEAYNVGPIETREGGQIPDALVSYPQPNPPVVVVIECKATSPPDARQACEIKLSGPQLDWDPPQPITLLWSDLMDQLWALVDQSLMGASEERLLLDFFEFVDVYYHGVGPYSTLRRCGRISERIVRRCQAVIGEATNREAQPAARGLGPYVEMDGPESLPSRVVLNVDEDLAKLRLSFWPGDTTTQARAFYSDSALLERVITLANEPGWAAETNMHFGHWPEAGLAWLPTPEHKNVADYVHFWRDHQGLIRQTYKHRGPNWDDLMQILLEQEVISSRETFDSDFGESSRKSAAVRPGIELYREWDLPRAEELDEQHQLVPEVRDAYLKVMECFEAKSEADSIRSLVTP